MGEYVTEGLREKRGEWKSESASWIVSRRLCERERECVCEALGKCM